jgi:hypothetical protein
MFLFTDLAASTRLREQHPEAMQGDGRSSLSTYLVGASVEDGGGSGVGDAGVRSECRGGHVGWLEFEDLSF